MDITKVRIFLLVSVLISTTQGLSDLQKKQINGIRSLLKNPHHGAYPTCHIVLFSDLVDFDTAKERCREFDIGTGISQGNLATVNDDEKNADLKMLLEMAFPVAEQSASAWLSTKWVWAGLSKTKNNEGKGSKSMEYHTDDWQWVDGSNPGSFHMWLPGQPDQRNLQFGEEGCNQDPTCFQHHMRISHGGMWDDTFDFKKHPFACDYQGKYILSTEKKSWEAAKTACDDAGLHLATIQNNDDSEEMMSAIGYFLGPRDDTLQKWEPQNWSFLDENDIENVKKWVWVDDGLVRWEIVLKKPVGDDNSENKGERVMSLSKWSTFDVSDILEEEGYFACECPAL